MTTKDTPPPFQKGLKPGPASIVRSMAAPEDRLPGTIALPNNSPGLNASGKPLVGSDGITTAMRQMTNSAGRSPIFKPPRPR